MTQNDPEDIIGELNKQLQLKREQLIIAEEGLGSDDLPVVTELRVDAEAAGIEAEIEKLEAHIKAVQEDHL